MTNIKSLGILVDERLNWERQYKTVHNKSRRGRRGLLSNVYRALVESHIRYADVIWGSLSNTKIESLQRLQDRAVSMIHTSRIKDNWTPRFLSVEQLITFDRAVLICKIFIMLYPENLWNKFNLRSHYSRYNMRFCRNIQIRNSNLEYAKKEFSYPVFKAWNEIPISIRELPTLCHFKKQLKMYLMS